MTNIFLTFAIAAVTGMVLLKLKVPGGMMVGAIIGAAALNISTGRAYMPSTAKLLAQSLAGAFIGCSMSREDIRNMKMLGRPAVILLSSMLCLNLILGTVLYKFSSMDLLTSLMCAIPGGMSDVPIIAADLGADAAKVALMQFVRMVAGIGVFPSIILAVTGNEPTGADSSGADTDRENDQDKENNSDQVSAQGPATSDNSASKPSKTRRPGYEFPLTLMVAIVCGSFGKKLGIPAGALVFSMIAVMGMRICLNIGFLPRWAKRIAQILSGAYIGCGMAASDLATLKYMIIPALLILIAYSVNCFIIGHLLHRYCGFPLRTGMLIGTPAGASDMALISADLGVESKELVELQIIRMVVVVSVFPQIACLIVKIFG